MLESYGELVVDGVSALHAGDGYITLSAPAGRTSERTAALPVTKCCTMLGRCAGLMIPRL